MREAFYTYLQTELELLEGLSPDCQRLFLMYLKPLASFETGEVSKVSLGGLATRMGYLPPAGSHAKALNYSTRQVRELLDKLTRVGLIQRDSQHGEHYRCLKIFLVYSANGFIRPVEERRSMVGAAPTEQSHIQQGFGAEEGQSMDEEERHIISSSPVHKTKTSKFFSSSKRSQTVLDEHRVKDDSEPASKIDVAIPEVPSEIWQWRVITMKAGFSATSAKSPKAMVQYQTWLAEQASQAEFNQALFQAKAIVGMPTSPLYLAAIMRQQRLKPSAKQSFAQGGHKGRAPAVRSIFGSFEEGRHERTVNAEYTTIN
jgi:hypothetical protein